MADQSAVGASASAAPDVNASTEAASSEQAEAVADYRKIKHKLKTNNREEELDYDEVIRRAQKSSAADEVFRSASAKEKKLADLIDKSKKGDLAWLEEMVGDEPLTKWAEQKLLKMIERQEMSPEQRELLEERARREKLEGELKSREDQETETRQTQLRHQVAESLDGKINEAFKAASLPMTPGRLERVAQYMHASLGTPEGTLLDPAKALERVKSEIQSDARELLEGMTVEELSAFLPRKLRDALRLADVADVRAQNDPMRRPTQDKDNRRLSQTKQKRMSTDQFFNQLERKLGG